MNKSILTIILILLLPSLLFPQENFENLTQTVKGSIVDMKTLQPIIGVNIRLANTSFGAISKNDGSFRIDNVPVGRYSVYFSSVGYEPINIHIIVNTGREEILDIHMQEAYIILEEVKVVAQKNQFNAVNESAIVSSNVFSMDDVERFAGSRMDPARMAQNFAGVVGANDIRNDIIIRGGSPTELLWRLDGLDVPNLNHFGTQGATGGPVNAINSNILTNSDFLIGAWPAEYGDKMSGVFDLKTRKGNDEKFEYLGQFGFNGVELGAEGPLPGKKNSFIANYRYSFLDLLDKMGMDFGFSGIPRYQDGILKLDLQASDRHQVSLTGMFGISMIDIQPTNEDVVYESEEAIHSGTDFYTIGVNWQHLIGERSYGIFSLGTVSHVYINDVDSVGLDDEGKVTDIVPYITSKSKESYKTAKYTFHYSPNSRHYINSGIESRFRDYNLFGEELNPNEPDPWLMDETGDALHMLSYINWNWRITENLRTDIGIFAQYLEISKKTSIEPRFAVAWEFAPLHAINFGFGVHRQSLPLIVYFTGEGNESLDFIQSLHYVAGYSYQLSENSIVKLESFYKDISNAPVEREELSSWSFLNSGADFGIVGGIGVDAVSEGSGRSYGLEFTFIKHFIEHYYVTATASYIRQQYKGSDGILRFGAFDNIYVANLLSGYEWVIDPTFTVEFSGKFTVAGGNPYIPIDLASSIQQNESKYYEEQAYSVRKPDYSRFDIRVDFRNNYEGFSITSYISAENVFNTENIFSYVYDKDTQGIKTINHLGFFFVGGVKIEF